MTGDEANARSRREEGKRRGTREVGKKNKKEPELDNARSRKEEVKMNNTNRHDPFDPTRRRDGNFKALGKYV
jgi:hypothetical protein